MSDYFCPECDRIYTYLELDRMRPEEKITVQDIANHALCSCGYEGSLWPNNDQGRYDYLKFLKNSIQYLTDLVEAGATSFQEELERIKKKYKNLTGETLRQEEAKAKAVNAWSKWGG